MLKYSITEEYVIADKVLYPDKIELGKTGGRLTVAFNANNPKEALERIDMAFLVRGYAIESLMLAEKEVFRKSKEDLISEINELKVTHDKV